MAKKSRVTTQLQFQKLMARETGSTYADGFNIIEKRFISVNPSMKYELFYVIWSENHPIEGKDTVEAIFFGCNVKISLDKDTSPVVQKLKDAFIQQLNVSVKTVVSYSSVDD